MENISETERWDGPVKRSGGQISQTERWDGQVKRSGGKHQRNGAVENISETEQWDRPVKRSGGRISQTERLEAAWAVSTCRAGRAVPRLKVERGRVRRPLLVVSA